MIIELAVTAMANGGSGIGHHNGKAVFVAGAVAGDVVRCRIEQNKKRYARARLLEVLEASPQRCRPLCAAFGECGGCDWQQMPYAQQCYWKQQLFADNCRRHGHIDEGKILPLVAAEQTWAYRSRVQFKCYNSAAGFVIGFYRRGSHYVVGVDTCPVLETRLNELIAPLRAVFDGSDYAACVPQIDAAVGSNGARRVVVHYIGNAREEFCRWLLRRCAAIDGALLVQCGRKSSLTLLRGDADLAIEVDEPPLRLCYGAGGFAQIHLQQNRRLVEMVVRGSAVGSTDSVLDMYCGMGNFSLPLARRAARVTGVEDYAPSITSARRNASAAGLDNTTFYAAAVEGYLRQCTAAVDVVVLDPPRSGARAALDGIMALRPRTIVYVSCDPHTLMRDLAILGRDYSVTTIQAVDMFPHTCHTEAVAILTARRGG